MSVKGLHKIIYPFAPDQSGAASVLYELGGMIIIVDAGGCAGNICGFDEPRWLGTKSAVFSAGLRDMDAILGRDDLMIDKIAKASKKLDAKFIALVGTPVPATIATDYKALRRMAEKRTGLPVITVDTNGARWYDEGIEKAYLELFKKFAAAQDAGSAIPGSAGVIGVTPLDMGCPDAAAQIAAKLGEQGISKVICYGAGGTCCGDTGADSDLLSGFCDAGRMERSIVVAPAGLKAARWLKDRYGVPYECTDPLAGDVWEQMCRTHAGDKCPEDWAENAASLKTELSGKRVLIIHQQIRANSLRSLIRRDAGALKTDVATWFMLDDEIKEEGDFRIREESDLFNIMESGAYDVIIADGSLRKAAKGFGGMFLDLPHFAVSGRYQI